MHALVTDPVDWWTRTTPDKVAITQHQEAVTYRELAEWSDHVADELLRDGLRPRQVVGILSKNSIAYCAVALGIVKAGGVVTGFSPRFTDDEVSVLVRKTAPFVVYVDEDEARARTGLAGVELREIATAGTTRTAHAGVPRPPARPEDPVVIVFTSGTTGTPKGVTFSHQMLLSLVLDALLRDPIPPEDLRILGVIPLHTSGGVPHSLFTAIVRGGTLELTGDFDPQHTLEALRDRNITMMMGVASIWKRISELDDFADPALDLSHLKVAMAGGARVPADLVVAWRERGVTLRQLYGMTELGGTATMTTREEASLFRGTCGKGGPFTRLRVLTEDGAECAAGEVGEIHIASTSATPGYWGDEAATNDLIADGWIRSGDLGLLDESGMLTVRDRKKDVFSSHGTPVFPSQVEDAVMALPHVRDAVVLPVSDGGSGQVPGVAVYHDGQFDPAAAEVALRQVLDPHQLPRQVVLFDEPFPRLPSGKAAKAQIATLMGSARPS